MSLGAFLSLVNLPGTALGVALCMTTFAYGFWKGWWVPGPVHKAQKRETRFWQRTAWIALGIADRKTRLPDFEFDQEETE